ncbi:RAM signaling network component [Mortierella alpina]|nr:RAM signaling network component [Mortierella alpina]
MSQGGDGGGGGGGEEAASATDGTHSFAGEGGSSSLMDLIHQRQGTTGSTQILDLSHAHLEVFPTEIEFLRDVLEKLTMSHNSIKTLPLQLNMFTSLRYLNIRANSIKTFPAVLCHLASLEILDMSRNKISRFPDNFGNLMNLRVLSISRNRIDTIPLYVGDMPQLQFLKIEMNPIVFPPPQIVEYSGQDMAAWLSRLKTYLVFHQNRETRPRELMREENSGALQEKSTSPLPPPQARAARSASESMTTATTHRQSRSESGLRLSIPSGADRPAHHPAVSSPESSSQIRRSNSQGDDHYRAFSHSRGMSGDSSSSFGSNTSNDCEKYSEVYFQRLAAYPPLSQPLPSERVKLVEAARGILFALSQIYRAVKQVVGCSTDEKFSLPFVRLLQSANSAMTQLIQSLDKFDSSAQVQVPDQPTCAEIVRCCESNVGAFRKLVHMVQMQLRNISVVADARLVRNLVLMLHGALSEIRVAWDSLLPLIQTSGDTSLEANEAGQSVQKDQQQHGSAINSVPGSQQPHPFQLSPTMPSSSTWLPAQIPHRSQNMSRTSNHSSQSTNMHHHDDEEDVQLLFTVERAIESARRLIQSLTETCVTRVESFSTIGSSPQQKPLHRSRSVSASPPRSIGGSESSSAQINDAVHDKTLSQDQAPGGTLTTSPLQSTEDAIVAGHVVSSSLTEPYSNNNSGTGGDGNKLENGMIRSPLFSSASDTVPYSSGMCVSLPIVLPSTTTTSAMDAPQRALVTGGMPENGKDSGSGTSKQERRPGSHTRGSSKTSFDPALPSIPQDSEREISSQTLDSRAPEPGSSSSASVPQYQPIMTARSVSVSGLPSTMPQHGNAPTSSSNFNSVSYATSSLPSQGLVGPNSGHQHSVQQPMTPGIPSSTLSSYPFPSNGIAAPTPAQLWHELRDCLLQMTEIVKRLDLDLTMIRTDDHPAHFHPHHQNQPQQHLYQPHQQHHHTQFAPHHNGYQQNHIPHPHQVQQSPSTHQYGSANSGFGPDESNILRRRFGMGVSDFVKSVVVISTLVRQLSSSTNRSSGSGSGSGLGSGSAILVSSTTTTVASTSSVAVLSTSPSTMRTGSISNSGPDVAASSTAHGSTDMSQDQKRTITPSISASSSASGSALTASPEKVAQGQQSQQASQQHGHPHQHHQHHSRHTHSQQQQQQQQHPEIFSRLVMTNVSNLTKVTRELTVRMPRSSFREYLLSTSSSQSSSSFAAGSSAGGGTSHGPSSYGYGPVGASILAMRKGSLI